MNNLNDFEKDMICDAIFKLIDNFNDNELDYAIYLMNFWKSERKRQDIENKELKECK
jgi:hypothetical protein